MLRWFTQTYGINYPKFFASVAKIRILLPITINFDWPFYQLDVKNIFLNGEFEEEVFMDFLPDFKVDLKINKVCKFKNLYMAINNHL